MLMFHRPIAVLAALAVLQLGCATPQPTPERVVSWHKITRDQIRQLEAGPRSVATLQLSGGRSLDVHYGMPVKLIAADGEHHDVGAFQFLIVGDDVVSNEHTLIVPLDEIEHGAVRTLASGGPRAPEAASTSSSAETVGIVIGVVGGVGLLIGLGVGLANMGPPGGPTK